MTSSVVSNTSRITVISAKVRADLAVPLHLSVAELLATLVSSLGRDVADEGAAQGGWILQRASEAPLDPSATLAACQVRDGDVLHLRTRATQLPEIAFDDVLDAVATGVVTRTARWHAAQTAIGAVTVGSLALGLGLIGLLISGPSWTAPSVSAGLTAVLLLLLAVSLSRVYAKRGAALTAIGFSVAFAASCGACALGGRHDVLAFGAPQLLVGACAAVLVAVVAVLSVGIGIAGLVTLITVGMLTAIGTAVASETTFSGPSTAALIAAVALALSPFTPTLSFKLSRLPLPSIPADAADLRRDDANIDSARILGQAIRADQFLTGLVGGAALAIGGAAIVLATGDVSARVLAVVLGAICLLRARLFSGRGQRGLLLSAGCIALLAVASERLIDSGTNGRLIGVVAPAVVVALALFGGAVVLPERRYAPPLSRFADILETLLVLSVIPLALAVMGVYGSLHHYVSVHSS